MLSLPELDSKDSEEEQKTKRRRDASLLDKDLSKWQDQKISEGHQQWDIHDKMTCDHTDPCKEAKSPDPIGPPLDYMMSRRIFKPKKTSEYALCHFYQVGRSQDLPEFPLPHAPATHEQVSSLLLTARALGWPNLIVVHSQDVVTAVCLLHLNSMLRTASTAYQWRPKWRLVANPSKSFQSALSANTHGVTIHHT